MDGYLTIGDFAKLRNVDRKSLRYYERIGALIPAYTDPQTNYRYYKLEQLVDLDTILLCLELGIPLKQTANYKNQDGTLDVLRLFSDGKEKFNEKLLKLHTTWKRLESSLSAIQETKPFEKTNSPISVTSISAMSCASAIRNLGTNYSFDRKQQIFFLTPNPADSFPSLIFPSAS